jgi:uncharacterized damage-inducible protein DinB
MLKEALIEIYERDLNKLRNEIGLYSDEYMLWIVKPEINNSAGNLCLHLIGNLNHFIGATLGNSDYERDRNSEFSSKNVTRADLIAAVDQTIEVVKESLNKLSNEDLEKIFPTEMSNQTVKVDFTLVSLLAHFNYHLGQINYHRRLIP